MAICFCIVWMSGGFSRSVLYENVTTPSASSLSCFVQSYIIEQIQFRYLQSLRFHAKLEDLMPA